MSGPGTTQDGILAEFRDLAERWRTDAKIIGRYAASSDFVATLVSVADLLDAQVLRAQRAEQYLTITQYAEAHAVTPQTVRNWIRAGQLHPVIGTQGRNRLLRADAARVGRPSRVARPSLRSGTAPAPTAPSISA